MGKMIFWDAAERDLARLVGPLRNELLAGCHDIFDDWTIGRRLTGSLSGYRAHRVGVYRIIYKVRSSSFVEIVAIGHRKDIYERICGIHPGRCFAREHTGRS